MSKQQGQSPNEDEVGKKVPRKKKGKYELWMRHNPEYDEYKVFGVNWHKVRTYPTMEMAEKNMNDQDRKWNGYYPEGYKDTWQFEIRVKE